ncbi:MAG TPA: hypothetical protein DD412_06755 [Holosporales bacterium]|nr:hypothetical protein [Holosporales bacterium]
MNFLFFLVLVLFSQNNSHASNTNEIPTDYLEGQEKAYAIELLVNELHKQNHDIFNSSGSHIGDHFKGNNRKKLKESLRKAKKGLIKLQEFVDNPENAADPNLAEELEHKRRMVSIKPGTIQDLERKLADVLPRNKPGTPVFEPIYNSKTEMLELIVAVLYSQDLEIRKRPNSEHYFISGIFENRLYIFIIQDVPLLGGYIVLTGFPKMNLELKDLKWEKDK